MVRSTNCNFIRYSTILQCCWGYSASASINRKGVAMGTALAFMMAVTGLSLPEFLILKRVMKLKLILIFAGVVGLGIIFTGYLFNWIL